MIPTLRSKNLPLLATAENAPLCNPKKNTTGLKTLLALFMMVMGMQVSWGQTSYTSTSATTAWNASRWNNSSDGATYTSAFTANNAVNFTSGTYTFAGMGATVNVGNVTLASNVTVNFAPIGSSFATNGAVRTFDIGSGGLFDFNGQGISTTAGTGFIKTGAGVFATGAGTFTGGFTLNAGTVIARGSTGLGSGTGNILTLNGGTIASNGTKDFANTRFPGGIVIGGNVQFGEMATVVSLANSTADLSFANNVSLGSSLRTLTLGNGGIITLSGVISNTASTGITFAANANGTGKFLLSGVNTYTGPTTISSGKLALSGSGSIATSSTITVGSSGTLDVSGLTTALALGASQTFKASATGSNTTGTITVASSKGLTLGSTGGLEFTAYGGGATAPLTIAGAIASLALNSAPITVTTTTALAAGNYKLIAKGGSVTAAVSGTIGTLTMAGSGLASGATGALSIASGELILTVTASASLTPPALTAASSPTVDANFDVTFTDDATWRAAVTAVKYGTTTLTASTDYSFTSGILTLKPGGTLGGVLRTAGTATVTVVATGYTNATVSQTIGAGVASKLAISVQPTAPTTNGGALAQQPTVLIQDQYGNTTASTATVTATAVQGTWTAGGSNTKAGVAGSAAFSGLTATSAAAVTGATIAFSSGILTGVTSGTFNIPAPPPVNDNCSGAIDLTINATAISGTFVNSNPMASATINDVFYMFTPSVTGSHTITINGYSASGDRDLYIYSECPSTYSTTTNVVASGTGTSSTSETVTSSFIAGTSYKILVQDYEGTGGTFNIAVTAPVPTIIVSAGALSAVNTTYGTASASPTSFTVSGASMSEGITVTPPAGYEVSQTSSSTGYAGAGTAIIVTGTGTIASKTIYVRLAANASVDGSPYTGNITCSSFDATDKTVATVSSTVSAKALTISGLTGDNKPYDRLTTATATGTAAYDGLANGETFAISGTPVLNFDTATVGNTKPITVTGYAAPSTNYTVTQPSLSANITAVALTISGITADNKSFDGTTTATLSGTPTYVGLVSPETFSVTGTAVATFDDAAVGTGKTVNVSGYTAPSSNYTVTQPVLSADITAAVNPTISASGTLAALSTVYGTASTATSFTVVGSSLTDDILVTPPNGFEVSQTVGGASGYATTQTLIQTSGNVASTTIYVRLLATAGFGGSPYSGNIVLTSTNASTVNVATASSTVSTKALTITGLTANEKVYNGLTDVSVTGTAIYSGLENSETFTVSDVVTWAFTTNGNVGTAKPITQTGLYTVPSDNYSITQPSLTADITTAPLTITASAQSKDFGVASATTGATSFTTSGLQSSDAISSVTLGYSGSPTGNLATATAGLYTITPSAPVFSTGASSNYSITYATGTLTIAAVVPGAPTIGSPTVGNGQVTIAYTAPTSNGGSIITSYTATSDPGGFAGSVNQATSGSIVVSGLTNGTAYTFTVTATNTAGTGAASAASASATPRTVSDAPTIGTAAVAGTSGTATVTFTAPVSNGGAAITIYTVTTSPAGGSGSLNQAGSGTITVTGLTNGTAYTFTVTATNAAGVSAASAASNSVTPYTVPGAPTIGTATAGNGQATVTFTAPASNGGSTITTYTVTTSPAGGTGSLSQAGSGTITVTGLANGMAYTFTITATNAAGASAASAASNSVTPIVSAPTATDASSILTNGFTANWNAVTNATGYKLDVSTSSTFGTVEPLATDLFISEYVEGSSNNKYIEIFNGTGATVNLALYELGIGSNGGTVSYSTMTGSLLNGATIVYKNATAALTLPDGVTAISSGACTFNGDDAIVLHKVGAGASTYVDVIGRVGNDPGAYWISTSNTTLDTTLTRKSSIISGITTSPSGTGSGAFTTLETEWTQSNIDVVSGLGSHSIPTSSPSFVSGYNAKAIAGQSTVTSSVTGLTEATTYYYRVRATDAASTSDNSNVITVATKPSSVTWNGSAWSNTSGPDSDIEAVIAGNYNTTANGAITSKKLTVNSGVLTVTSGYTLTVTDAVINNASATALVFENNANLIQTNDVANTGNAIINRNSASIQLYDYTLWSSPVASQQLQAFSPSTLAFRFYTYDSVNDVYSVVPSPSTTNFEVGTGYLIRAPNNWPTTATPFNGVFTGVPNNGTKNLTGLTAGNFYAVGNPYPSTISANLFISGNSTGGTLYFWRKTNNALNPSYATYTTAGGVSNSDGGSLLSPNGTLQVGQGFIVKATAASLTFNNTMRTANNDNQFLKTTEEKSRFWLNLTSATGYFCQTMVAYMSQATTGVDNGIDGPYFNDSPTALTSIIEQSEFTIQGKPLPFNTNDTVPLGFKTNTAGNFTIGIDHVDGLFSNGQTVFLKDNLANTTVNLSAGAYTFASEVGVFNSRFEIVYQSALVLPTFTANNVVVYSQNGDVTINSGTTEMDQVRIFDVRGRLLAERSGVHAAEIKLNIGAQNQVLLVKITAENGSVVTKKIIQ